MTVLIVGHSQDPTLKHFACYLRKQNPQCDWLFLNQDELGNTIHLCSQGFSFKDGFIAHIDITGVWNRLVTMPNDPIQKQSVIYLYYLLDEVYPNVINRPKYCTSNFSKHHQLRLISTTYLQMPSSIISNQPYKWMQKIKHPNEWIYKSLSCTRSIVTTIKSRRYKQNSLTEPMLIQKKIIGTPIRVHVVGKQLFSVTCTSDHIDYRYGSYLHMDTTSLPNHIESDIVRIHKSLKLGISGVDLIQQGDHYSILEINTCPGFCSFDLEFNICDALYRLIQLY
ncbi:MAG: ATP-grasp domain-containing protein [Pseudomonadota bacterium]|nr:ATP-grasp domain-containing protein [Pseudomonadota bacterium]